MVSQPWKLDFQVIMANIFANHFPILIFVNPIVDSSFHHGFLRKVYLILTYIAPVESLKCCESVAITIDTWDAWDTQIRFRRLKSDKKCNKITYNRPMRPMKHMKQGGKTATEESHASVREKRQRQATLLLFVQKVQERSWPVSQVWQGRSYECTRYELRVETGDIRPVLSLFRLKSRLDEFLGLLSSFVPIKADARRTMNNGNWKYCWQLRSALLIEPTAFLAVAQSYQFWIFRSVCSMCANTFGIPIIICKAYLRFG